MLVVCRVFSRVIDCCRAISGQYQYFELVDSRLQGAHYKFSGILETDTWYLIIENWELTIDQCFALSVPMGT
ncbi:hypothetical protein D0X99_19540 [Algoriphagus lacus]|uniref:Uncharacterized protein n=1 Tax=Algoriphagus lacus TaxID=2056311 RepID=A0A418PLU2_9BACT|nr:hypothetical protein D0X99_19540 [Algoriphagus lacus]